MTQPPAVLARRLPGDWQPVDLGRSPARVWRVDGDSPVYVKAVRDDGSPAAALAATELDDAAHRCLWLAGNDFPVPRVRETGAAGGWRYVVSSTVPGRTLAGDWPSALHRELITGLAAFARDLHGIGTETCPFRRDLSVMVPAAIGAVRAGAVDEDDFDEERAGRTAEDVLQELLAVVPATEDPVVCHGDLCLPNVLADPETGRITGVIDLGRVGTADRHQDLALAARSLGPANPQYGPDAAQAFLSAYGLPVDPSRLAFYRLLDEFF